MSKRRIEDSSRRDLINKTERISQTSSIEQMLLTQHWAVVLLQKIIIDAFNSYIAEHPVPGITTVNNEYGPFYFDRNTIIMSHLPEVAKKAFFEHMDSSYLFYKQSDAQAILQELAKVVFLSRDWSKVNSNEDILNEISKFQNDLYQVLTLKLVIPFLITNIKEIAELEADNNKEAESNPFIKWKSEELNNLAFSMLVKSAGNMRNEVANLCCVKSASYFGKAPTWWALEENMGQSPKGILKDGEIEEVFYNTDKEQMSLNSWSVKVSQKISDAIHSNSPLIQKHILSIQNIRSYNDITKVNDHHNTTTTTVIFIQHDNKIHCKLYVYGLKSFDDIILSTHGENDSIKITEDLYHAIVLECQENAMYSSFLTDDQKLELNKICSNIIMYGQYINTEERQGYKFIFSEHTENEHTFQECVVLSFYHRPEGTKCEQEVGGDIVALLHSSREEMLTQEGHKMFATLLWDFATGTFFARGQGDIAMYLMKSIALSKDVDLSFSDEWTPPNANYDMQAMSYLDRQEFVDNESHNIILKDLWENTEL